MESGKEGLVSEKFSIRDFEDNAVALDIIEKVKEGYNIFITGKAGYGKSTLLKVIMQEVKRKCIVTAPTGIAAKNVDGVTLHSFFNLPFGVVFPDSKEIANVHYRSEKYILLKEMSLLVIDEVSMTSSYILDCIDYLLRKNRGNNLPFGGVQVVLIGDLFQLPPVVNIKDRQVLESSNYKSELFFDSKVFKTADFKIFELKKNYRQEEEYLQNMLDKIRLKELSMHEFSEFNLICIENFEKNEELCTTLTATNAKSEEINRFELSKIESEEFVYVATKEGIIDINSVNIDEFLILKKGAKVMFLKNNKTLGVYNGTLGVVKSLSETNIVVLTEEGLEIFVTKENWENFEYVRNKDGEFVKNVIGKVIQYPIKLAYSCTTHKSQGLTFKKMIIDTGYGMFAAGQLYVALSRCRSLDGLLFKNRILYKEIIVDNRVKEFFKNIMYGE